MNQQNLESLAIVRHMDFEAQHRLAVDVSYLARVGINDFAFNILNEAAAGIRLIPSHYYEKALFHSESMLGKMAVSEASGVLKENIRQKPGISNSTITKTYDTGCDTYDSLTLIYYELERPYEAEAEKEFIELAETVDELSGVSVPWRFTPRILLAAIRGHHPKKQALTDAFEQKRPDLIGLEGAVVVPKRQFY